MRKKIIAIITSMCLALTACGANQQENSPAAGEPESAASQRADGNGADGQTGEAAETADSAKINWIIEEEELPDADAAIAELIPENREILTEQWSLQKETVCRMVFFQNTDPAAPDADFFQGCCLQRLDPPYTEWKNDFIDPADWGTGEAVRPWNYRFATVENGFRLLLKGEQNYYIGTWTEEAGASADMIENDSLTEDTWANASHWQTGQDGSLFLWGFDELVHTDSHFEIIDRLKRTDGFYVDTVVENRNDGNYYLICPAEVQYNEANSSMSSSGVSMLTSDGKQTLLCSAELSSAEDRVCFLSETEGYLYQSFDIAKFSLEDGEIDLLYDFSNDPVYFDKMYQPNKPLTYMNIVNGIQDGYAGKDGSHVLLVACSDGTYQIWHMYPDDGQHADGQKQILEWATTVPGAYEQLAVSQFNRENTKYKIVFRLPDEGEDYEDFRIRIQAELAAGDGPDILSAGAAVDVDAAAKKGFLIDLTDSFTSYEEEMLASAWKLGMVEGKRYAVPYSCTVTTIATDSRLVNGQERWTLEEAMRDMEESGIDFFMAGAGEAELFFYLGLQSGTNPQMVDWSNGVSHLNSESAAELLEFAERYADDESTPDNIYAQAADKKAMTALIYLLSPENMRVTAAMFDNREVYIGFPVEDGGSGHLIQGSTLAVNQACSGQEGAIAFLEFLLSGEMQSDLSARVTRGSASGFPVSRSAMEEVYSYLQEEDFTEGKMNMSGGLEYEAAPLSEKNIRQLRELLEIARPMESGADKLFSIVDEEIGNFRSGDRSAAQVLDIVNNRAQLYLSESGY